MELLSQILKIVVINLMLSGDNAVVIAMAAHRLEPKQRRAAILIGGAAAIALRIPLTVGASMLLALRGLQLVGGILLLWIGCKMLKQEEEGHEGVKAAASMSGAITTILVADLIMSVDNVLGVAAAAEGHTGLLIFGLVLSMGILMFMGSLVADLINKAWWLAYVGAAVIAWTGADMIFKDPLIHTRLGVEGMPLYLAVAAITMGTLSLGHFLRTKTSA